MYPSIFTSFRVIQCLSQCVSQKMLFSRNAAHIFVSPGDAPAIITQYVAWMERQFNACQTPCTIYLSIFNSFRIIRCLSQCISPKIAIFTTFLPRDAMHKRGLCSHAVSVRLSVTFVDHVKTNKHIFEIFSPSGSDTILVFFIPKRVPIFGREHP